MSLIAIGYQPPERTTASASAVSTKSDTHSFNALSVDDVVAASVAANIAQTANLPIATNVANLSQSLTAESMLTENESNIVTKPQIVEPMADSRKIQTYTAKTGDTVDKIADRYGISPQTIKWANNMTSDAVEAGRKVKILPIDGVIYKVKRGDTVDSIANRYDANKTALVAFNDLEIAGLKHNSQIIIPNASLPRSERPGYVAPQPSSSGVSNGSYGGGYGAGNPYLAGASAGNRYAFGNCTWYAFERRKELGRPVGSFWGNAATWAMYARAAGFSVNGTPSPGAIMANGGGYGHVAIVESVDPGKSITISEMNGYRFGGGFNRVGTGQVSWGEATSGYYQYIN